jgi:hypothetical protein
MSSSEVTDTYIICYTRPSKVWAAYSIKTGQAGTGADPKEALANGINAADQVIGSASDHDDAHTFNSLHELMLTLARISQPLPDGECVPGVVYKYERA